jgi:hypothetical protein
MLSSSMTAPANTTATWWRILERIFGMAHSHSEPRFIAREYKDGRGWYVEATIDGGSAENVGDFASDSEAKDWIARKSMAYSKARRK